MSSKILQIIIGLCFIAGVMVLVACKHSTPPGARIVSGNVDNLSGYQLIAWDEGLRILIFDDLPHGAHHHGSSASTGDPIYHVQGGAQDTGDRAYEYTVESADGIKAEFTIDGTRFDLDKGTVFLIHTSANGNQVNQLQLDLSGFDQTNASLESFAREQPEIAAFSALNKPFVEARQRTVEARVPAVVAATVSPAPEIDVTRTGIAVVDKAIEIIQSNDLDRRLELVRLSQAACTIVMGLGGPPSCDVGQPVGTEVAYLPVRSFPGEGEAITAGDLDLVLDFIVQDLFAAYTQAARPRYLDTTLPGSYAIIFSTSAEINARVYVNLHLDEDGRLVQIDYLACPVDDQGNMAPAEITGCSPLALIESEAIEILVPPPDEILFEGDPEGTQTPGLALPSLPAPTTPAAMTPTVTPLAELQLPTLPQSLYFLTRDPPTSSALGGPHSLWRLAIDSPVVERLTPEDQHVTAVAIHPGDGRVAYGTGDGSIYLLDQVGQPTLLYLAAVEPDERLTISSLSWSPTGETLAFTSSYRDAFAEGENDGLWLVNGASGHAEQLVANRHLEAGQSDVSRYREIINVDYSPDGLALLLLATYWEYADLLWLSPITQDASEQNLHDPEGLWLDGSWSGDGKSILVSGWTQELNNDLARVVTAEGQTRDLIDGGDAGLFIRYPQEVANGIAFVGWQTGVTGHNSGQLYLGAEQGEVFEYSPARLGSGLCPEDIVTGIAWDDSRETALISCTQSVYLFSLGSSQLIDLAPYLVPMPQNVVLEGYWGA